MSNSAFGYRLLRGAGLWGSRGLWLGVGVGAATVLAVTALARKSVRKACGSDAPAVAEDAAAPEPAPVRPVKARAAAKAKAEAAPVRAVRATAASKLKPEAEAPADAVPTVEGAAPAASDTPSAKPAPRRKRTAKAAAKPAKTAEPS